MVELLQTPRKTAELITGSGGRITRTRVAVLDVLQGSAHSLSHDEIAALLVAAAVPHDRVTLYRTLDWLVERGLAHRIKGLDRAWRFNIGGEQSEHHAHFHCERCGHVLCLPSVRLAERFALPAGYRTEHVELVFRGTCPDCRDSEDAGGI